MIHKTVLLFFFIIFSLSAQTINERNDLKKFFDEYNHEGCFILYDLNKDEYLKYNPKDVLKDLSLLPRLRFSTRSQLLKPVQSKMSMKLLNGTVLKDFMICGTRI
jgi:hypothetical protein